MLNKCQAQDIYQRKAKQLKITKEKLSKIHDKTIASYLNGNNKQFNQVIKYFDHKIQTRANQGLTGIFISVHDWDKTCRKVRYKNCHNWFINNQDIYFYHSEEAILKSYQSRGFKINSPRCPNSFLDSRLTGIIISWE